jgi:hypothetical protein
MMPRAPHPKPLFVEAEGEQCKDNFGRFPHDGEHVGQIANVHFSADVVTLDLWVAPRPPYRQVRFEFGSDSLTFRTLVAGVRPHSGPVVWGSGYSHDFSLMPIQYRIEGALPVAGYQRANLVGFKFVSWSTLQRAKKSKGTEAAQKDNRELGD